MPLSRRAAYPHPVPSTQISCMLLPASMHVDTRAAQPTVTLACRSAPTLAPHGKALTTDMSRMHVYRGREVRGAVQGQRHAARPVHHGQRRVQDCAGPAEGVHPQDAGLLHQDGRGLLGRVRGDHHRRQALVRDDRRRHPALPRHQRQRLRHQVQGTIPIHSPICASVASPGLPFVLNGTTDETHADNTSATTDIFVCHFVVCVCTIHSSTTCTAAATLCRTASCAART